MELMVSARVLRQDGPTPTSEMSTSTTNCLSESGIRRMGDEVNGSLRILKAAAAGGDHWKAL